MSATAYQLRRRQAAAQDIVAQLGTAALRRQFIKAVPFAIAAPDGDALYAAIAGHTDPPALLALAEEITSSKRRRPRRRKTETK